MSLWVWDEGLEIDHLVALPPCHLVFAPSFRHDAEHIRRCQLIFGPSVLMLIKLSGELCYNV